MDITPYTTTAAIRAALGVTDNEVSDQELVDQGLEDALLADLYVTAPSHATIYTDGAPGSPTDEQAQLWRLLKLYCLTYCVALVADNWLAFPSRLDDGQAAISRSLDFQTLQALAARAAHQRDVAKATLTDALDTTTAPAAAAAPGLISISAPAYDPVAGS